MRRPAAGPFTLLTKRRPAAGGFLIDGLHNTPTMIDALEYFRLLPFVVLLILFISMSTPLY
jgi:hypothetical protein